MSILPVCGFRYLVLLILNPSPNRNLTSQGHLSSVNSLVNICLIYYIYVKVLTFISSSNVDFIKRGFLKNVSLIYSFHLLFLQELQAHVDQITEMAAVMRKAIEIDEQQGCKEQERIFQLEVSFKLHMSVKTICTKIYARKYLSFLNIYFLGCQ